MTEHNTIQDEIDYMEGGYGLVARIITDYDAPDPWDGMLDGTMRYVQPPSWSWGKAAYINDWRREGWTVIPVSDCPDGSSPSFAETDAENANGFLAGRWQDYMGEWSNRTLSKQTAQRRLRDHLRSLIELRSAWYQGGACGWTIGTEDDAYAGDSCWGYYNVNDCARDAVQALRVAENAERRERVAVQEWAERDVMTVAA